MTYAITEFVQGLLPGLKKDTVTEDLRVSIETLNKNVIPTLDKVTTLLRTKFSSKLSREIEEQFNRAYKGKISKQPNMLLTVKLCMPNILQNAEYVLTRLEDILEATIVPDGLTSRKAAMIRASKQISFLTDFTTDLMNIIMILETLERNGTLAETMEVSKGTHLRVSRNIVRYAYAITDFSREPKAYTKLYEEMKDLYVAGDNVKNLRMAGSEIEIDPFDSRIVQNVAYNPIYHARMLVAQWQAKRYHAAKDKKKLLELRVLQLKAEQEGKGDPRILNEINYTQGRIDRLDNDLHDTETDLGVA